MRAVGGGWWKGGGEGGEIANGEEESTKSGKGRKVDGRTRGITRRISKQNEKGCLGGRNANGEGDRR